MRSCRGFRYSVLAGSDDMNVVAVLFHIRIPNQSLESSALGCLLGARVSEVEGSLGLRAAAERAAASRRCPSPSATPS